MRPLFEDKGVLKIGHNLKFDWQIFAQRGIDIAPYDDTMLMSYVVDSGRASHDVAALAKRMFDHTVVDFNEITKAGKTRVTFDCVPIERAAEYAAEDADATLRLWHALKPRLAAEHMTNVYQTLERPLIAVLGRMEGRGISIDRQTLARLSGEFATESARLEEEAQKVAGQPFNLGSPKQIGDVLFGSMGLPGGTKTKTGAWSTSAQVLEELAEQGHELPQKILDWRQVSKLRSTYTDALPTYVDPKTQRVHTNYALAATTTGRLSSSEPNLQNIPIRTEAGRKIRKAFIAQARPQAGVRRLFADRTATAGGSRQRAGAAAGLQGRHRHSRDDRVRNVRRAGQGHAGRSARAAPRRSISASSTASRRSGSPTSSAFRARKPAPTSRNISSASRASATTWTRPAIIAVSMAMSRRCSAANAITRTSRRRIRRCAPSTNAPRSTRGCRARPPISSAAR